MPRAIASLSLSFGLVSIPVKLFSATEASSAVRFKLMRADGARVRQQYVSDAPADEPSDYDPEPSSNKSQRFLLPDAQQSSSRVSNVRLLRAEVSTQYKPEIEPVAAVVERNDIVKGYEFEKGRFVLFTPDELKALHEASRQTIDIVSFVPQQTIDPVYYDKAYLLAPEKRGSKPYSLLHEAMRTSGRCALAKWAWRSKQYVVQVRAVDGGLVLQQLRYAEEVRSVSALKIELVPVAKAELQLALQLIEHISEDRFDPTEFVDEERQRILAAVEKKIAGQQIVAPTHVETPSADVIDLMAALRASLTEAGALKSSKQTSAQPGKSSRRKPPRRAANSVEAIARKSVGAKK